MATFFFVLEGAGWQYGTTLDSGDPLYRQATTACLAGIVLAQMANLFVCRHPSFRSGRFPLLRNPLLPIGLAIELALLLAIVYTPNGNRPFTPRVGETLEVWLYAAPFALALVAAEELRKRMMRRTTPPA